MFLWKYIFRKYINTHLLYTLLWESVSREVRSEEWEESFIYNMYTTHGICMITKLTFTSHLRARHIRTHNFLYVTCIYLHKVSIFEKFRLFDYFSFRCHLELLVHRAKNVFHHVDVHNLCTYAKNVFVFDVLSNATTTFVMYYTFHIYMFVTTFV